MINPIRFIGETITGIIGADGAVVSLTFCGKKIETIMPGSKKCDSWVGTRQGSEFIGGYCRGFRFLAPRRGTVPDLPTVIGNAVAGRLSWLTIVVAKSQYRVSLGYRGTRRGSCR